MDVLASHSTCTASAGSLAELPEAFAVNHSPHKRRARRELHKQRHRDHFTAWLQQPQKDPRPIHLALEHPNNSRARWAWPLFLIMSVGLHAAFLLLASTLVGDHQHTVQEHPLIKDHAHNPVTLTEPPPPVSAESSTPPNLNAPAPSRTPPETPPEAPTQPQPTKSSRPQSLQPNIPRAQNQPAPTGTPRELDGFSLQSPTAPPANEGNPSSSSGTDPAVSGQTTNGGAIGGSSANGGASANGSATTLANPVPQQLAFEPPALLDEVSRPVYPPALKRQGIEGTVILRVSTDAQGRVTKVVVLQSSGRGEFDQAATRAAYSYRFKPARKGGVPMPGTAKITSRFRLDDN